MQINRLFNIIYILLSKRTITAKELAERLEVSVRTIYRDIDILSNGGIPIYTNQGKGGGITLHEDFIFNKSMLSENEQNQILMSLQNLNVGKFPHVEPLLNKLKIFFNREDMNWIDVDFSHWGSSRDEREKFDILKNGIFNRKLITFYYFNSNGEKSERTVEPLKLVFKGQNWYVYGFCTDKNNFRIFKITRIKNLRLIDETFERKIPKEDCIKNEMQENKIVKLILRIEERMSHRIYDEFNEECIRKNEDGSFNVTIFFPEDEWVYGYILSYGNFVEVLEPKHIREIIKTKLQESLNKYL